jgi:serine/threonine protein kinase
LRKDSVIAKKQVNHTKDEKHILQKILHPFIVRLYYAFQTKGKLYMIMDFVNGGELFQYLKNETRFSEERVVFYAAEIALALIHLHSHGIVYRDLKPENILLDAKGHIVITDFGLCKEINDDNTETFCGTPEYLAPEIISGEGHGYPVDWWSLGTLIFEMLTGLPPFYSSSVQEMFKFIMKSPLRFPDDMSENAKDLLKKLLERDPSKRICGSKIKKHPFFASIDWVQLEARQIDPPFIPPVTSPTSINCIDPDFTNQDVADSLITSWVDSDDKDLFEGFTYNGQNLRQSEIDE